MGRLLARNEASSAIDPAIMEDAAGIGHFGGTGPGETAMPGDCPMTIGETAREFGITLRALRFYEAKHLIAPQRDGAIRLYRRSDCERLTLIMTGRRLGFTLAEIGDLLGKPDGNDLHLTREQCVTQINLLEQQKRGIEIAIAELRQIYTSFYRKLLASANGHPR
jgi:DNA-binding transcriptional MerR regulator